MKTTFTLPDDTSIRFQRNFDAPIDRVWAAYTDPAVVREWLRGPDPQTTFEVCEMDIRPGGRFRWVWRNAQGELEIHGEVLEVDAPHRLVTSESMGGADWPPTRNEVTLAWDEATARTTLSGLITYATKDARDGAYASGMGAGMDASFDRMEERL